MGLNSPKRCSDKQVTVPPTSFTRLTETGTCSLTVVKTKVRPRGTASQINRITPAHHREVFTCRVLSSSTRCQELPTHAPPAMQARVRHVGKGGRICARVAPPSARAGFSRSCACMCPPHMPARVLLISGAAHLETDIRGGVLLRWITIKVRLDMARIESRSGARMSRVTSVMRSLGLPAT